MSEHASAWIMQRPNRPDARLRLFCFPHAGAGAAIYRGFRDQLPASIDVCAIEPPGRLGRRHEQGATSMPSLIAEVDVVLDGLLDRPFAIFGYSLGATMAFEWARALRRRGRRQPVQLIVAASSAPQLPRKEPPIAHLPPEELLAQIELRYGPFDPAVRGEPYMLETILGTMRSDLRMLESYVYRDEAPLGCPLFAIGGTQDETVPEPRLAAWSTQTTAVFRSELVPGDHFFIRTQGPRLIGLVRATLGADAC